MIRRNFSNEFCPNLPIFLNESFAQRYALARSRLGAGGVAGPAAGRHPLLTGSVGVDGDQADIAFAQLPTPGVHTFGAGLE